MVRNKARRYNLMAPSMALQHAPPKTDDLIARMPRAVNPTGYGRSGDDA